MASIAPTDGAAAVASSTGLLPVNSRTSNRSSSCSPEIRSASG
jgi:hypothetical protein